MSSGTSEVDGPLFWRTDCGYRHIPRQCHLMHCNTTNGDTTVTAIDSLEVLDSIASLAHTDASPQTEGTKIQLNAEVFEKLLKTILSKADCEADSDLQRAQITIGADDQYRAYVETLDAVHAERIFLCTMMLTTRGDLKNTCEQISNLVRSCVQQSPSALNSSTSAKSVSAICLNPPAFRDSDLSEFGTNCELSFKCEAKIFQASDVSEIRERPDKFLGGYAKHNKG